MIPTSSTGTGRAGILTIFFGSKLFVAARISFWVGPLWVSSGMKNSLGSLGLHSTSKISSTRMKERKLELNILLKHSIIELVLIQNTQTLLIRLFEIYLLRFIQQRNYE